MTRATTVEIDDFDIELPLLVEAIHRKFHYEFRGYARSSMRRRMAVAMRRFECASLSQLQDKVLHRPEVFPELLNILTVQVSEMFRDPAYYRAVREVVVPVLRTYPSLKFWVAGCSTGEEVYSFAILLKEEGLLERTLIYATDINADALERARSGVYDLDRVAGFTANHRESGGRGSLSEHYTAAYGGALFDRALVQNVIFADHSLATDSVFAETHFVSCRNVLIYFDPKLQDRALGLFRESLCRKGYLGIGARESVRFSARRDDFAEVAPGARIYRKQDPA